MTNLSATAPALYVEPNSIAAVRRRLGEGRVSWTGPVLLIVARTTLWMTAQTVVALLFLAQGRANPWHQACYWWSVCFTLADIGCVVGMRFFLGKEGLRLRDLVGPVRLRHGRDVFLGVFYFLLFSPGFFAGGLLAHKLFYGNAASPGDFILHAHALPLWATVYSLVIFWPINSLVEEMTYQGYVLPRLEALTGRTWIAFAAVAFWFTAQHCVIGFVPNLRSILFRFFAFLPGVVIVIAIYLRTRRLAPLIVGHWIIDLSAVLMTAVW
jgi:membrane protease YdiL (CAAX protease family)